MIDIGPDQFRRYQECRGIVPVDGRCQHDGLRVWPKIGGGYRHDPEDVRLAGEAYRSPEARAERARRVASYRERHEL